MRLWSVSERNHFLSLQSQVMLRDIQSIGNPEFVTLSDSLMLWRKHSIFEPKTFSTLRIHSNMSSLWGIKNTPDPFRTNLWRNKFYWVCRNISVLFSFEFGVRYDLYINIADSPKKLAKIEQLVDHEKPSIFE